MDSTIFAVSTGPGRAGIAVVRLSGPSSQDAVHALCSSVPRPREMALRKIRHPLNGVVLDEAIAVWLPGPRTVTGEDMAELHLHGSPAVVSVVLSALGEIKDLRVAEPGEFTRRAYQNGRMDLVAVEGLVDLLAADTEAQRQLAMRQFLGEASGIYEDWHRELIAALALIEAGIDFSEEDDQVAGAVALAVPKIERLLAQLRGALQSSEQAGLVRAGLRVVIAGPPNAGKSSLLNWLAKRDVALVTPYAGTTRDVVEAGLVIDGYSVTVSDTAGLRRHTADPVEELGMARTRSHTRDADILIWVMSPDTDTDELPLRKPDLVLLNKSDLIDPESIRARNDFDLAVSVHSGAGLHALRKHISLVIKARSAVGEHGIVVRERHKRAVSHSIRILNDIKNAPEMPLELMAEKMRKAAAELASITGRVDVEDVLGEIFSSFCIGK